MHGSCWNITQWIPHPWKCGFSLLKCQKSSTESWDIEFYKCAFFPDIFLRFWVKYWISSVYVVLLSNFEQLSNQPTSIFLADFFSTCTFTLTLQTSIIVFVKRISFEWQFFIWSRAYFAYFPYWRHREQLIKNWKKE